MPRIKKSPPQVSRQKGQRSQDIPDYISRYVPAWTQPEWLNAQMWRRAVAGQPIAMVCRERMINYLLSLDWKVEPRDGTKRDEYKEEILYYTKFFQNNGTTDYADLVEWVLQDYLDIPFGAGVELGRENDDPNGRLLWVEPLDGGTLFPSLSYDYPVGQRIPDYTTEVVYFPYYGINRLFMTPRTEIRRKGYGTPPPEKIYLALELLNRGDRYYANLLLDTPPVGLLDLGDMAEDSAKEWLNSWHELLTGVDPFKIPVLYEHEKPAQFITFQKSPTEMMFDKATMKYASLIAAGYSMSLSDIGISMGGSGGDTLAGTIRQERGTRRSGFAKGKLRLKYFFDRMLPEYLQWKYIDLDDELSLNTARARLANANAFSMMIDKRMFSPVESRGQMHADGLMTIPLTEEPDEAEFAGLDESKQSMFGGGAGNNNPQGTNQLGRPIAPSQGGWGEKRGLALDIALENPEFRSAYTDLEGVWDRLNDTDREAAVGEIKGMLDKIENDIIALEVIEDAINTN